jgi:cation diffusion facilitator family transporter
VIAAHNMERYQVNRRAMLTSMAVNLALTVAQVVVGVLGHSQALVADAMHTFADLTTDVLVLYAAKHGAKDADEEHPYGHGRIETAASGLLSLVLIGVGAGIAINAGLRLAHPDAVVTPSVLTLVMALITIAAKEGLYRYTMRIGRETRSNLLQASAWHHRSDALSSVIVAVAIAGSLAGFYYLDAIAAIGVALMIANMGVTLGWRALRELIDTGLDAEEVARIRTAILAVAGVKALHLLRTRQTGGQALVDVHIQVDATLSVSEGHQISEAVRAQVMAAVDDVMDVLVHIDPEDDESAAPNAALPLRDVVTARLRQHFRDIDAARHIEAIGLHYLSGRLRVELLLPLAVAGTHAEAHALIERFRTAAKQDPQIGALDVRFH